MCACVCVCVRIKVGKQKITFPEHLRPGTVTQGPPDHHDTLHPKPLNTLNPKPLNPKP